MKRIFLMRHSIPEKRDMPNEQIPLSEEGKALALSKSNVLSNVDRCFSSPYRRAVETAELIVDHPFIVEELHERTIGDAKEDFWLKQYEDYDFHNPGGESLNQVRTRMKMAVIPLSARWRKEKLRSWFLMQRQSVHICFLIVRSK